MNTPTLKTAIFAAETVAHLHSFEHEILPLTDLAREMDAEIGKLRASQDEMARALKLAAELFPIARQHFPKLIRHSDKFTLENTCATVNAALHNHELKPAPPETPQSARQRKCLDDNSRLHD
jgi:hypothetical protein